MIKYSNLSMETRKIKCSMSVCVCVYSGVSKTERGGERDKETGSSITLQKFKNIF